MHLLSILPPWQCWPLIPLSQSTSAAGCGGRLRSMVIARRSWLAVTVTADRERVKGGEGKKSHSPALRVRVLSNQHPYSQASTPIGVTSLRNSRSQTTSPEGSYSTSIPSSSSSSESYPSSPSSFSSPSRRSRARDTISSLVALLLARKGALFTRSEPS